jgi:uncharacterized membrane protein
MLRRFRLAQAVRLRPRVFAAGLNIGPAPFPGSCMAGWASALSGSGSGATEAAAGVFIGFSMHASTCFYCMK